MHSLPRFVGLGLLCLSVTTACSGPAPATLAPPAAQGTSPAAAHLVTATAKVVPADVARLSFVISATVKQVALAAGASVHAGQALIALDSPELSFAEQAAVAALNSAMADEYIQSSGRRKWDGFKFVWMAGPPEQRQVAHARVLQAQAALAAASAELAQATLVAPFDGTVVSVNVSEGELVQAGQIAVVIGNLARLQVETTDLSERQIAGVRLGQKARVHLKAIPAELAGVVRLIAPMAGTSPDGDTIFKVTIELDRQDPALLWGMTGDAELDTQ
jgi:multidrug efflux pump subunit AcrA (membrane-fusion protein)